nr:tRNA dihydrouridine(20/20a) synthase DusA [Legionella impletisoli]
MSKIPSLLSPLAIAPMIDWTYTHFRVLMRLLAPNALLYTDMQTPGTLFNNPSRALQFHRTEKPLALQLGGATVDALVRCAQMAEAAGFDEVNLNLGCPSDRVQAGRFGACMMAEPDLVSDCIIAMKNAVGIPVTAKTRIGIDQQDSYEFFAHFAHRLVDAGADKIIVHARKAWLKGLNPKQNRTIPPIHYEYVYRLKKELGAFPLVINGNITCYNEIQSHLTVVDGVMLGRLACQDPYQIAHIHHKMFPGYTLITRVEILTSYFEYALAQYAAGVPASLLLKPVFGFAYGLPNGKRWKEGLLSAQRDNFEQGIKQALDKMQDMEHVSSEVFSH